MQVTEKNTVFKIPNSLKTNVSFPFCPGCDHGVALRLVAELLEEFNLKEKALAVASSGCSVMLYNWMDADCVEAPHGRGMAVATGAKRTNPDKFVFTYQGDGDFASIGLAESLHAALRGEKVTAICINNTTYGMTGGQGGPTTILGQVTTTSPMGRDAKNYGYPIKIAEQIALCDGTAFSARGTLDTVTNIKNTKNLLRKAFESQTKGLGFGFVEIVSTCPTNWHMTPQQSHERVRNELIQVYKPGIYKEIKELSE